MNDLDLRTALHRDADLVGEPSPDLLDQLVHRRQHQRRQRAGILAAAAAVLVIGGGIPVVSTLTASSEAPTATRPTVPSPAAPTEAAPTTSVAPAPSPEPSPEPPPAPVTPDPEPAALVLGPDGLGSLKLGMSTSEAEATGMLAPRPSEWPPGTGCRPQFRLADDFTDTSTVWYSDDLGVAAIEVNEGVLTPEGIGIGSPLADVDAAYPGWRSTLVVGWRAYPPVTGSSDAVYRITIDDEKVTSLTMQRVMHGCYE